jgi:hypothetical protein
MKKRNLLTLTLTAALVLLLGTGCSTASGQASMAEENAPDVETVQVSLEDTALIQPAEDDLDGAALDEYTRTLTGFQGLPWGYVLPQRLAERTGEDQPVTVGTQVQFAGLDFQAERVFRYLQAVPGLERGEKALVMGQYIRQGYDSAGNGAAADFDQVVDYLTRVYGAPDTCGLIAGDGTEAELTEALFQAAETRGFTAVWGNLEGARITATLSKRDGVSLTVTFAWDGRGLAAE